MSDPAEQISEGEAEAGGFRALYRAFFDHAEKKRRWNVADGIPWDQVKQRAVDEDLVEILEAFYSVEMFLPDYASKLSRAINTTMRLQRGQSEGQNA